MSDKILKGILKKKGVSFDNGDRKKIINAINIVRETQIIKINIQEKNDQKIRQLTERIRRSDESFIRLDKVENNQLIKKLVVMCDYRWHGMKTKLSKENILLNSVQQIWENFDKTTDTQEYQDLLRKCCLSFRNRIYECVKIQGNQTKY
ncbi:hypothetical protein ABPG73_008996 [Tetrahymena malaccensis]